MIDQQAALAALRSALADAVASDFVDALPIDRYADSLPGWAPRPNYCHDQVALWLQSHPEDTAVRGWMTEIDFGHAVRFVAHSLVRTAAGRLLDVAFLPPKYPHHFIEHPIPAGDFLALVRGEPPVP